VEELAVSWISSMTSWTYAVEAGKGAVETLISIWTGIGAGDTGETWTSIWTATDAGNQRVWMLIMIIESPWTWTPTGAGASAGRSPKWRAYSVSAVSVSVDI
jgi:hypothetical protein